MVKKAKAKARLDKYYHLAKETGFRSRAAFKLIQLNKKFDFLSSAHVLVDLCAAPGGWLQVAATKMPVNSLVIGVDLVPIKPVKGVITFVGDVTTAQCLARIRSEIKHMKVDVVLHDGAPNVGQNWEQDAFSQNELVLKSLKLASKVLREGGTFVTKVFRSADYNSLLWVFNQVFNKVSATKPMASRAASAEIFVVCQGYKGVKAFDPKVLDPKHAFMESEDIVEKHNIYSLKQLVPDKPAKRKPLDESRGLAQFRKAPLARFVDSQNPYQFLADNDQLTLQDEKSQEFLQLEPAPKHFDTYCSDIRVLGKPELRILIRWRKKVSKQLKEEPQTAAPTTEPEEKGSDEEIEEIIHSQEKKAKKLRKKERERLKKIKRADPNGETFAEEELFTSEGPLLAGKDLETIEYTDPEDEEEEVFYEDDEGVEPADQEASDEDSDYEEAHIRALEKSLQNQEGIRRNKIAPEEPTTDEGLLKTIVDESMKKEAAARWFQRSEFADVDDFQAEEEAALPKKRKRKQEKTKPKEPDFEVVPRDYPENDDPEAIAETIALGTAMLRKKRRRDIVNYTYNRYTFHDSDSLPDWFTADQKQHYQAPLPVTAEELREARRRVEAASERPIKKVMEAIGRRKRKLAQKLDKIKPKVESLMNQTDISEGLKIKHMQKLYKKEIALNKPKKKYIVTRRVHKGKYTRKPSRNVRFVDKRLKKDKRSQSARK